jgi:CRP/FNR family transcriptional regulator, cyclic AMP receptor protein
MEGLERFVREHAFFAGMDPAYTDLISGCAKNVRCDAGQYLFHQGDPADFFYLIRHGRMQLEINAPARGPIIFQTLGEGEIMGVSWLVPPYRCSFDAKALELTRALAIDAKCLRGKSEENHDLGYELMKRFMPILAKRLQLTRLQIMDVYGRAG